MDQISRYSFTLANETIEMHKIWYNDKKFTYIWNFCFSNDNYIFLDLTK